MALEVVFYRRALKELQGLPKADRDRVLDRRSAYAAETAQQLADAIPGSLAQAEYLRDQLQARLA